MLLYFEWDRYMFDRYIFGERKKFLGIKSAGIKRSFECMWIVIYAIECIHSLPEAENFSSNMTT